MIESFFTDIWGLCLEFLALSNRKELQISSTKREDKTAHEEASTCATFSYQERSKTVHIATRM